MSAPEERIDSGPLAWMAANPVAANLLMAVILLGGLVTAFTLKQESFPELESDVVSVTVPYPGASPQEVEQGIVLAVEEAVRGIRGDGKRYDPTPSGSRPGSCGLRRNEPSQSDYDHSAGCRGAHDFRDDGSSAGHLTDLRR